MADLEKKATFEEAKADNKSFVTAIRSGSNISSSSSNASPRVGAIVTSDNVTVGEGDVVAYDTMHWIQTGVGNYITLHNFPGTGLR